MRRQSKHNRQKKENLMKSYVISILKYPEVDIQKYGK